MSESSKKRREARLKRKMSIRKKSAGTAERPRVCGVRSHKNIYAQVVDDDEGSTLLSATATRPARWRPPRA